MTVRVLTRPVPAGEVGDRLLGCDCCYAAFAAGSTQVVVEGTSLVGVLRYHEHCRALAVANRRAEIATAVAELRALGVDARVTGGDVAVSVGPVVVEVGAQEPAP